MSLPRQNLVLTGLFEILEGQYLKFEAKAGVFGTSLSASSWRYYFGKMIDLDLEPLIGKTSLI